MKKLRLLLMTLCVTVLMGSMAVTAYAGGVQTSTRLRRQGISELVQTERSTTTLTMRERSSNEVLSEAVSAVRCSVPLGTNWKKRIDEDFNSRKDGRKQ